MRSISLFAAALLAATTTVTAATPTTNPTAKGIEEKASTPTLNAQTVHGCFNSVGDLTLNGTILYNSKGACAKDTCYTKGYPVAATSGGNQCYCGKEYPPKAALVDDSNCNIGCAGYDLEACGGINFWTVYNTGVSLVVDTLGEDSITHPSGTPTDGAVKTVTGAPVVVTQTNDTAPSSGGGTNVGAVAGGVSVAVIVVLAAIGGMFFYMRRKRNREIEEEHRRNAAASSFISGKAPSSSSGGMSIMDARLDPVLAHRRMSDGSIADNQDYSRKILRVTNA